MTAAEPTVHRAAFSELDPHVLYGILQLRAQVFVVEQDCVFLEPDGRDTEATAEHLWISDERGVVAAARLLDDGDRRGSIGRVVTRVDARSRGLGGWLIRVGLARFEDRGFDTVHVGAQAHLAEWYARFGFSVSGPEYDEDGIPHVPMALLLP